MTSRNRVTYINRKRIMEMVRDIKPSLSSWLVCEQHHAQDHLP